MKHRTGETTMKGLLGILLLCIASAATAWAVQSQQREPQPVRIVREPCPCRETPCLCRECHCDDSSIVRGGK